MGVKPVYYNNEWVTITKDNANDILSHRTEIPGITESQIKYAESFLTEDERDKIFYSEAESKQRGKEAVSLDADGDGKDDIQAGDKDAGVGAAAETAVNTAASGAVIATSVAAIVAMIKAGKVGASINGFCGLACAIIALAGGVVSKVLSLCNVFDPGFDQRKAFSDANGDNLGTLDGQKDGLVNDMDLMNMDMEDYKAHCENYTSAATEASNQMAELQIALADAQAAGDTNRIAEIQAKIAELQGADLSEYEEGMEEKRAGLEQYSYMNNEAVGMTENSKIIADYLKVGNTLAPVAKTNMILLSVAAALAGIIALIVVIPKCPFAIDGISGGLAAAMYGATAGLLGWSAGSMGKNADNESEFGNNGDELQSHADQLTEMANQHQDYMDQTLGTYDELDESSEEEQEENAGEATGAVTDKTGDTTSVRVGGRKNNDDDDGKKT
ncbi:MAG: DUF1090 domain-containing protein [Cyanobacteria bacterium RUI128]|nr:DUF1090 domain-containing protein [Cyanobacteria bacterium RUI128]